MNLTVTHTTDYQYSTPASLGPHVFRLRPRCDGALRLLDFNLAIEPKPAMLADCLDAEGNTVTHACFTGLTERLTITSRFQVETLRTNPFDYLLDHRAETMPFAYPSELEPSLACYCSRGHNDDVVLKFACAIAKNAGWRTSDFLLALNASIHEICAKIIREKGAPQPAEETLRERRGSCRDFTVLFIEACRSVGIASRFVSGYQKWDSEPSGFRYMHAWPEVFLPGGGWRGYDPSQGLAVADSHVPVAACRESSGAAPISGAFGPPGVSSTMQAQLMIC
jgi:transglutaminase-like putative cysteine protease